MSARSFAINEGATLSITGGTSKSYVEDGVQIVSGVHVIDNPVADFRLRPNATIKVRPPRLANGVYSKGKTTMVLVRPKLKADGTVSFPLARLEVEDDSESTVAEIAELYNSIGQLCFDAELANLRAYKALST
jgi:uncharacterized protein involved in exopolysaccharide biosynthesis